LHRVNDHRLHEMVLTWNVYRRSLVGRRLSRNPVRRQVPDRGSGPQGLRRPRFSFFLFTCQTARDHGGPTSRLAGRPSKP